MCQRLLWKERNIIPGLCALLFPMRPTLIICVYNLVLALVLAFV